MKRKEVYKPKSNLYKEFIKLTQSDSYSPKSKEWFKEKFEKANYDEIEEALVYLCHTHYLKKLSDETYAMDIDFRVRVKGIYHFDGVNGHVHADSVQKLFVPVQIPQGCSKDAMHNDRVEAVVEGELSESDDVIYGKVIKVLQNFGEMFVGKLQKVDENFVVFPEELAIGRFVLVEGTPENKKAGSYVLAKLTSNDKIKSCKIIKFLDDEEERSIYKYGFYPEISKTAKDELINSEVKPGKPVKRIEFTDKPATLLHSGCAVNIERDGKGFKIAVHVPDLCDKFVPESESEKELLRRCAGKDFLPQILRDKVKFRDNCIRDAFTVLFDADENGNISNPQIERTRVLTVENENPLYEEACRVFLKVGGVASAANDAAAIWFDENDAVAPFANVYFADDAKAFIDVLKTTGLYEGEITLNNAFSIIEKAEDGAKRLMMEFVYSQVNAFGEENVTVPFCTPLENYLSVLAQYCVVQHKKLRTTKARNQLLRFVYERASLYNYRQYEFKKYFRAHFNIKLDKKLKTDRKYEGIYITKSYDEKKALFYVCGGIGSVKCGKNAFKTGDKVVISYEGISIDRQELVYKLATKKGNTAKASNK